MNLSIRDGALYVDNMKTCFCEAGNGRSNLPTGRYAVTAQYSHVHGKILADAIGLGWIGAAPECDIVLGGVRCSSGVIPSPTSLARVLARIEGAEDAGESVTLEVCANAEF